MSIRMQKLRRSYVKRNENTMFIVIMQCSVRVTIISSQTEIESLSKHPYNNIF